MLQDLQNKDLITKMATIAKMTPEEFIDRYGYIVS